MKNNGGWENFIIEEIVSIPTDDKTIVDEFEAYRIQLEEYSLNIKSQKPTDQLSK